MTPATTVIAGGDLVVGGRVRRGDVRLAAAGIVAVGEVGDEPARVVDAGGLLVAPGFVDLQCNGGFGHDLTSDVGAVWQLAERLQAHGVTAFLPTIVSSAPGTVEAMCDVLAAGPPPGWMGALPLGVHAEGPMLSMSRRGTHDAAFLRPLEDDEVRRWSPTSGVRMVTLAPELPGATAAVTGLTRNGVLVAAGHSEATFEEAVAGFDAGARVVTHLHNAMPGARARRPGLAGAALARADVTATLISDGVHLHPGTVAAAWRAKGADRLVLVSDGIAAMGLADGTYRLGSVTVTLTGDEARNGSGDLAGSAVTLDACLRNLVAFTGSDPAAALAAVTTTPARLLADATRGRLDAGARADLVLLDDALAVAATVRDGVAVYDRDGRFASVSAPA